MAEDRFIRVKSGAVYNYTDALAKRRDAIVVDGPTAAAYFRSINSPNAITKKYPEKTAAPKNKARAKVEKPLVKGGSKPAMVVSDEPVETDQALEELLDGTNIS